MSDPVLAFLLFGLVLIYGLALGYARDLNAEITYEIEEVRESR